MKLLKLQIKDKKSSIRVQVTDNSVSPTITFDKILCINDIKVEVDDIVNPTRILFISKGKVEIIINSDFLPEGQLIYAFYNVICIHFDLSDLTTIEI